MTVSAELLFNHYAVGASNRCAFQRSITCASHRMSGQSRSDGPWMIGAEHCTGSLRESHAPLPRLQHTLILHPSVQVKLALMGLAEPGQHVVGQGQVHILSAGRDIARGHGQIGPKPF